MQEEKTKTAVAAPESDKQKDEKKPAPDAKADAKPQTLPDKTDADPADDDDINPDDLFKRRPSITLTPENARFYESKGGMISLECDGPEGHEIFERVIILRSFPVTAPDNFFPRAGYTQKGTRLPNRHDPPYHGF